MIPVMSKARPRNAIIVPLILAAAALVQASLLPGTAGAQDGWYAITSDKGEAVQNFRVPVELGSEIERLPGAVVVGNPRGDVTIAEFYDLNCPYCRQAAPEIARLVATDKELRLVLVPFPVLSVASIEAARVELAVSHMIPARKFYQFHHDVFAGRGVMDGTRALAVAKALGLDSTRVIAAANEDTISETMKAHVRLGNALGLSATPSFVIKGVAILGYPGPKALEEIAKSVRRCDNVVC